MRAEKSLKKEKKENKKTKRTKDDDVEKDRGDHDH